MAEEDKNILEQEKIEEPNKDDDTGINTEPAVNDRKMTWIFVGFLVVLLLGVIYLAFTNSNLALDEVQTYSTTVIDHKITEDGTNKTVKVTCDIDANSKAVDQKQVDESVQSIVENYSYEQLTDDNAMDSLKSSIITELQKQVGFENVSAIYISEYDTNYSGGDDNYTAGQEQRNNNMKGLFKKMN